MIITIYNFLTHNFYVGLIINFNYKIRLHTPLSLLFCENKVCVLYSILYFINQLNYFILHVYAYTAKLRTSEEKKRF